MVTEIAALKLELDPDPLPLPGIYLPFRLAVRKSSLYRFNRVTEFSCRHAEKENDALFVDRLVS